MAQATEEMVTNVSFLRYMDRDGKLRADPVHRTFTMGGLQVAEIVPRGDQYQHGDPKYRITATAKTGSLEGMLDLYQERVATGAWPNTSGCRITREPPKGEKKGNLLELCLDLPDGRGVSAPRMVMDLVRRYTGIDAGKLQGRVNPGYLVESRRQGATAQEVPPPNPIQAGSVGGNYGKGWVG